MQIPALIHGFWHTPLQQSAVSLVSEPLQLFIRAENGIPTPYGTSLRITRPFYGSAPPGSIGAPSRVGRASRRNGEPALGTVSREGCATAFQFKSRRETANRSLPNQLFSLARAPLTVMRAHQEFTSRDSSPHQSQRQPFICERTFFPSVLRCDLLKQNNRHNRLTPPPPATVAYFFNTFI